MATPVVSIKDVVRSSLKVPEFDKHLKKAGGHIGRNVMEITKMKTIVRKPLMIKISKLRLRNLDKHLKKAGGHIVRNGVEIAIKMKTIVRKPLIIKICQLVSMIQWFLFSYKMIYKYKWVKFTSFWTLTFLFLMPKFHSSQEVLYELL